MLSDAVFERQNGLKYVFGRGSAPGPAERAYRQRSPRPPSCIEGLTCKEKCRMRKGTEGKGRVQEVRAGGEGV